jgi:hypothetical protein
MWETLSHRMSYFELNAVFWDLNFEKLKGTLNNTQYMRKLSTMTCKKA